MPNWMNDVETWNAFINSRDHGHGFINFPPIDDDQTGENGLNVFLVVLDEWDMSTPERDRETCWGLANAGWIELECACPQNDQGTVSKYFPDYYGEEDTPTSIRYTSAPLLFACWLGTTRHAYLDGKDYWQASYNDLTDNGKALVALIEKLYIGHKWALLTMLDT